MEDIFDILAKVGLVRDPVSAEERTGPMLFHDTIGGYGVLIVPEVIHRDFEDFKKDPNPSIESINAFAGFIIGKIMTCTQQVKTEIDQEDVIN